MTDTTVEAPALHSDPAAAFEVAPGTTYMDAATYGLPPRATTDAMRDALERWSGGLADWIEDWDRPAEDARSDVASLMGVPVERVALLPAVSVGVGLVAATLGEGDEVLVPADEFTSVSYPFHVAERRGVRIRRAPLGALADAVTPATSVVATSLVQMQTGRRADLPSIRAAADRVGARIVLDATQAVPFIDPDEDLGSVDIVLAHGYKHLLCPRGAAFMSLREDMTDVLAPSAANWRAAREPYGQYFHDRLDLGPGARGYDVSLGWFAWVGARTSLGLLRRWRDEGALVSVRDRADRLSESVGLGPADSTLVCVPVADPAAASDALRAARIKASVRGGAVRLAIHLWNTDDDIARTLEVLRPFMPR